MKIIFTKRGNQLCTLAVVLNGKKLAWCRETFTQCVFCLQEYLDGGAQ